MTSFRNVKGTSDILPEETPKWKYIESEIHRLAATYNYREVRTPMFEETQVFTRGVGADTDIVSKEMYTFTDQGNTSLTLKPELTAPVVRSYIQHHYEQIIPVNKLYYITPLFRQERPQAGRQRQFHQFGIEIIGSEFPEADAEAIAFAMHIYKQLGLTNPDGVQAESLLQLRISSIGDENCRPSYIANLRESLFPFKKDFCNTCQQRLESNPLRIFDCKRDSCQAILDSEAPMILEFLCNSCKKHFESVISLLDTLGISYRVDPKLVRGLDYYTRTTFEITSDLLGAQNAICGGGRYDHLVQELGGPQTPAVGFAAGIERLIMVMEQMDLFPNLSETLDLYIVVVGDELIPKAFGLLQDLRQEGIRCDMDMLHRSVKAQFREANRQNSRFTIVLGENEFKIRKATVKTMASGEEKPVAFKDLVEFIQERLSTPQPNYHNDYNSSQLQ